MAKQTINIGSAPNDGTGDTARDAFDICNDNFTELYDGKVEPNTAFTGDLVFNEAADHASTPAAGKGYLWVKNDAPSSLIFTDDAGTDYDLTDITSTPEGTAILSTGEVGGTKFLREDGDGTSSWQAIPAPEGTSVLSTGPVTDGYVLTADGAGGAVWEAAAGGGGGAFTADVNTQITPSTAIVLDQATGNEIALDLSYTVNKATSGNDTGLLINQTDTASPGTSLLADFQVGGVSKFSVDNAGGIFVGPNTAGTADFYHNADSNTALMKWYAGSNFNQFRLYKPTAETKTFIEARYGGGDYRLRLSSDMFLAWSSSDSANGTPDTQLYRDASGVVRVDDALRISDTGYTVATLPTGTTGTIARVTDASSPTIGNAVSGGGAAFALVCYNGSAWNVIGV